MQHSCTPILVAVASLVSEILPPFLTGVDVHHVWWLTAKLPLNVPLVMRTIIALRKAMMQLIVWYIHMTHITCICQCIMTANSFGVSFSFSYTFSISAAQNNSLSSGNQTIHSKNNLL